MNEEVVVVLVELVVLLGQLLGNRKIGRVVAKIHFGHLD